MAIKFVQMTCPACKGEVVVDKDAKEAYCTYCRAKLIVDDGIERSEHTSRVIDDAEIIKAEAERTKAETERMKMEYEMQQKADNHKLKWKIIKVILIVFLFITVIAYIDDTIGYGSGGVIVVMIVIACGYLFSRKR